jgi:hypothetical protein
VATVTVVTVAQEVTAVTMVTDSGNSKFSLDDKLAVETILRADDSVVKFELSGSFLPGECNTSLKATIFAQN